MWKNKTVSVILPAFNEQENIKNAIEEFQDNTFVDDIIVIDNNSTDNTKREILKTEAKYIYEQVPGYGSAICRGLSEVSSDLIITCEPDGTFKADDIIKLLVYSDDYDVVFGTRTSKYCVWDGANMNWFLRYGNWAVAKFLEYLFNGPSLTDVGCTYKLINKETLHLIKNTFKVKKSHFQPEFMINSILSGKKIVEIPVDYLPRKGYSKITGNMLTAFKLGNIMIFYILLRRFSNSPFKD